MMTRSLLSRHLPKLNRLTYKTMALSGLSLGLCSGLMLIEAPAASAEAATSIEVRFSGVVHPPCYGNNADWSKEKDCELSRNEVSVTRENASEQPDPRPLTTAEETAAQWDGLEENFLENQLHRQIIKADRYTLVTLTPS